MASIIDKKYSLEENLINCKIFLIKEEKILKAAFALSNGTTLKYSINNESNTSCNVNIEADPKYCKIVEKVQDQKKILTFLEKTIKTFNEIISYCVDYIKFDAVQIIIKQTQALVLFVKKITLSIKRKVAELLKAMLQGCVGGKGSPDMAIFIQPIILLFQGISTLTNGILMGITTALSTLPSLISVAAEGMSFFMTPKSIKTTEMTVANANQSIVYHLPSSVMNKAQEAIKQVDKLNIPIKVASVAAGAALGAASAKAGEKLNIGCKSLNLLDPLMILKSIESIVSSIPVPQALPKFEKLSLTNLGFLAWLITGFEPAGLKSFGFMV